MLRVNESIDYWSQIFPAIVIFGIGLSITVAPLTSAVLGDIKKEHAGVGSAVNNAVARIAGLLAIALIGLVIGGANAFDSGSIASGVSAFHKGSVAMAILLLAGGLVSAAGIVNRKKHIAS